MSTITVDELERTGMSWLQRIAAGETLLVMRAGEPVAEIKPVAAPEAEPGQLRPYGLAAGEFVVPDDFDDPLPDELLDAFEGR
ncbi:MAG: type II toxin-antitoxin system Phd/YefM family antitoxin [Acidobacteria bacterium]|nr:type II toxin-antitoxin system Phd/YefM family antitoxin [Acidobacteriota bacterium]MBI3424908.1 type II toxin-antitoxin system Phd/YefM family antitoxin [Acidobacteriota bacterium]